MLHTMYFADEVRDFGEIEKGETAKIKDGRAGAGGATRGRAVQRGVPPEQYVDDYRQRVLNAVEPKVAGREVTAAGPEAQRAQVIDLMEALKQSLARRPAPAKKPPVKVERPARAAASARVGARREEGPGRSEVTVPSPSEG